MNVASLHVYPLKSGRAITLDEVAVTAWGLAGDRRYMVCDPQGALVTQREVQALAQVSARVEHGRLTLEKEGEAAPITAVFDPDRRMVVRVWDDPLDASLTTPEVDAEISRWLGRDVRLVHADALSHRVCDPVWSGEGVETGFADGYPILVATTGSLKALAEEAERRGGAGFGMDRFRPNIVIEDERPFADDFWEAIEIAGIRYDLVKPCTRCIMTTQDQMTGERGGPDPMPAMRHTRMSGDRRVAGVLFGWNAVPRAEGRVTVGDVVTVLSERPEGWPLRTR
ncbi:MOSC domain-containing protein [Rhizobium sp. G21]|uniref:MOSC domain-containing protein n=1 Tax=Rhizobium sp. G21 TaxID=2758439 RepID=UPI0015FF2D04|nr:MOSC N-terminal beta barrel domain-containing protein [Rhizobium sp. G21]MBB1248905.1 MOSC domain-containing protein [Rhizobium sp. G21]